MINSASLYFFLINIHRGDSGMFFLKKKIGIVPIAPNANRTLKFERFFSTFC